ncbi:MAG: hypothetical protein ACI9PP_002202 [Halobacteriales archaeon]|jgi:hypothetical protein
MPAGFVGALSVAVIVAAIVVPLTVHFLLEEPPKGQYDWDGNSTTPAAGDPWAGVTERNPTARSMMASDTGGSCSECGVDVDPDLSFCWHCATRLHAADD